MPRVAPFSPDAKPSNFHSPRTGQKTHRLTQNCPVTRWFSTDLKPGLLSSELSSAKTRQKTHWLNAKTPQRSDDFPRRQTGAPSSANTGQKTHRLPKTPRRTDGFPHFPRTPKTANLPTHQESITQNKQTKPKPRLLSDTQTIPGLEGGQVSVII